MYIKIKIVVPLKEALVSVRGAVAVGGMTESVDKGGR